MTLAEGLTSEQETVIEKFRARTKSFLTPKLSEDPYLFHRFLKARDYDLDKAENMLMEHITWRKKNQVDTVLEDMKPKEYFYKYVLPSLIGVDKVGDIVLYSASGKIDTEDILKCDKVNEYKKSFIWLCERNLTMLKEQSQKTGKGKQIIYIIDLDKLTFSNLTHKTSSEVWLRITYLLQDNYPESMKAAYVINAPGYYVLLYSLLKTVMSNASIHKIQFFGKRSSSWKEKLLNVIDANVLPAFLGGNRTDPDGNPLCLTFVNHSGKISPKYYLPNKDRYFSDISQVKSITVPHMGRKEIFLDVKEKGSIIKWEYFVKSKDIGFGLSFQGPEQSVKEEIIPVEKCSTVDGTEISSYKSKTVGKFIVIFDNSYSWMSSKEIGYYLSVIKPE